VPGALLEVDVRLGGERRGAGHEKAHARAGFAREAGLGEKARVHRRNAHEDGRCGELVDRRLRVELGVETHRRAVQEHAVGRHEEPVHVEERQHVDEHVRRAEPHSRCSTVAFEARLRVREHRALRAPGGPRRVQDRREIVAARSRSRSRIEAARRLRERPSPARST
jgi:hypothetical protein